MSSLLIDSKVKAMDGECTVFLNVTFVVFDPFGSSRCKSPIPITFMTWMSAVVISQSISL